MDTFSLEPVASKGFTFANNNGGGGNNGYTFDTFHTVLQKSHLDQTDDLFKPLKNVLIVGRLLGVLNLTGVFKQSYTQLSCRRKSLAFFTSLLITLILTFNLVLALIQWVRTPKTNVLEIARSIHRTAQYCWGWLIYVTFLLRADKFLELFKYWAKVSSSVFYSIEDKTLRRDSIFICAVILLSCILENAVLHMEFFKELDHINGVEKKYDNVTSPSHTALETYYWRSNKHWADFLDYHWSIAVLAFIQHKWMLYTWNYLDVILAVFGRALYFKFKVLYKLSNEYLLNTESARKVKEGLHVSKSGKGLDRAAWLQVATDHNHLFELVREVEHFFSPLVFGSYAVNIYYLCIQLLIGLSPDISVTNVVQSLYGTWGFLHMAMRIYIVSICAARINQYAHMIRRVLINCPIEIYEGEIARVDKRITSGPEIGLTGLNTFVITKPFILTIVSVIFTVEIVLLQGMSSGPSTTEQHSVGSGKC